MLLGAPSTGKTTLARRLAEKYHTVWMPEYGREFWERHQVGRRLSLDQLVDVAEGHLDREERMLGEANRLLFTDTNALTTYLFALDYHGRASVRLEELPSRPPRATILYSSAGRRFPTMTPRYLSVENVAFALLGEPASYLELVGTVLYLWSVWLVARRRMLTWPVGIASVLLCMALFYQIRLYSDALEQVYYLAASVYGWWHWMRASRSQEQILAVRSTASHRLPWPLVPSP